MTMCDKCGKYPLLNREMVNKVIKKDIEVVLCDNCYDKLFKR